MKKIYRGWVEKDWTPDLGLSSYDNDYCVVELIQRRRGHKKDWLKGDWPPRKITVTVEVEDE